MGDCVDEWKIFVGGLSWDTNEEKLRNYFSEFGDISECLIMKNPETGKSRGFGFVTFLDPNSVKKVLRVTTHELDGRIIDPKECNPRANGKMRKDYKNVNISKIFLGGLPPNVNETYLREFFSKYGKVTEAIVMFDQEKKKSRGFGFLSLDNEEAINKIVAERYVTINGKKVEVKRAEPQHGKCMTPGPNGMPGNMPIPYFVPPWPVWPGPMMSPMNGLAPNYGPSWNPTTAAVTAAAIAATAAASNPSWPYGYPGGWMPPFNQPGNPGSSQNAMSSMHGTNVSNVPTNFMQQGNNVNPLNQNAGNSLSNSLTSALGNPGLANFPGEGNNFLSRAATAFGYQGHNAHNSNQPVNAGGPLPGNAWNAAGTAFGSGNPGNTNSIGSSNPVSVSVTHHNETPSNNFNQPIPFHGSRIVSNQGYHPYRRS